MSAAQQVRVDQALEERDRQYRRYRAAKRAEYAELFADELHGDRLRKFQASLGHFDIDRGDEMVDFIRTCKRHWLYAAPTNIRAAALQMVGQRIVRIRERAGLVPFDDALPGEPDDVWQLCKRELGL